VERPADAFVASFIGQAILLDATAERLPGGGLRVVSGGLSVDLPADAPGVAAAGAGACTLAVRPWAVVPVAGGVGASVRRVAYLGQRHDIELELDDGRVLTAAVHEPARRVPMAGHRVGLCLHPGGCALVPAAAAGPGRAPKQFVAVQQDRNRA
jgi:iron(III) transport system ATP-binding protein